MLANRNTATRTRTPLVGTTTADCGVDGEAEDEPVVPPLPVSMCCRVVEGQREALWLLPLENVRAEKTGVALGRVHARVFVRVAQGEGRTA
jgi:hypothetical protein